MTKFFKRSLTLCLFLGILFAAVPRPGVEAQTERQPTEQQVKAHLLDKMQTSLKLRSRGFTGWDTVQANRKGSTLYAFVQSGKVVGFAIGRPNMLQNLKRFAPRGPQARQTGGTNPVMMENTTAGMVVNPNRTGTGGQTPVITGGGVKEQQKESGPSEEECAAKYVDCMFSTSALDFLRGLAMVKNVFTLDIDGLVENYEAKEESLKRCVGEACARVLAL